jgi:hypothetical protein
VAESIDEMDVVPVEGLRRRTQHPLSSFSAWAGQSKQKVVTNLLLLKKLPGLVNG